MIERAPVSRLQAVVLAAVLGLLLDFAPATCWAWGELGHQVVARVAWNVIEQPTKDAIGTILANDKTTPACRGKGSTGQGVRFVQNAVWPDKLRQSPKTCKGAKDWGKTTSPWHFLDMPVSAPGFDHARDCPDDTCVIAKITEFTKLLGDKTQSPGVRRDALAFVTHFVGDLHQPLHTTSANFDAARAQKAEDQAGHPLRNSCLADLDKHPPVIDKIDRGGNCLDVQIGGRETELHAVWDSDVVAALGSNVDTIAQALLAGVSAAKIAEIQQGTVEAWANDAHKIAVEVAYGKLPKETLPQLKASPPPGYFDAATAVAKDQLRDGGLRLAKMLADALR